MDIKNICDFNRHLKMNTLHQYEVPETIIACTRNNRHPMEALKKTQYKYVLCKKITTNFLLFHTYFAQKGNC